MPIEQVAIVPMVYLQRLVRHRLDPDPGLLLRVVRCLNQEILRRELEHEVVHHLEGFAVELERVQKNGLEPPQMQSWRDLVAEIAAGFD